jgi:hypothetical protein
MGVKSSCAHQDLAEDRICIKNVKIAQPSQGICFFFWFTGMQKFFTAPDKVPSIKNSLNISLKK